MANIITGPTPNFPATQQPVIAKSFKTRFRDQSVIPWITNHDHQGEFKHAGTEIQIPILPVIHTYSMKPGDKIKYQQPKSTFERFMINRERGWGIHIIDEDKVFARFNIQDPIITEATKRLTEDIEAEFFLDNIANLKCHVKNTGANAGFISKKYNFGSINAPVELVKNDAKITASQVNCTDYMVDLVDGMSEMPGFSDDQACIVCHSAVANVLHKGDLIHAEWMGDAKSVLRGSVKGLGELAGARIFTDNKLPIFKGLDGANIYPVLILNKRAISFVEEVAFRDSGMKDIEYWGDFTRSKMIYDWFTVYPEFVGMGFVKV